MFEEFWAMHMRVMTYNVHGWLTPGGQPNLDAVHRVIADSGADIVGLNEVFHPRIAEGSDGKPILQALAQQLGFHYVFGPCMGWPATDTLPESSYGNALLSRWPIIASAAHHLTPIDGLEQRGLLEGRILLPDGRTFTPMSPIWTIPARRTGWCNCGPCARGPCGIAAAPMW